METKKNKGLFSKILIIFIILGLLLSIILSISDFELVIEKLKETNVFWMLLSAVISILSVVVLSISNQVALRSLDKNITYFDGFLVQTTEPFFSGITPFGSGAQPFQIYEMVKKGARSDVASAVSLVNFIVFQTVTVIILIISLIIYWNELWAGMGYNIFYILAGIFFNTIILVLLLLLGYAKGFGKFVTKILLFFQKYRWSKKWATRGLEKADIFIENFQTGVKVLMPKKRILIASTLLKIVSFILKYGSIIFVLIALGHSLTPSEYLYLTAASFIAINAMMWVPLPGASGGTEFALGMMLNAIPLFYGGVKNPILIIVLLLWRFITYYLQLIIGFIAYLLLKRKNKKNDELINSEEN
ncbi:predicted lysylphosphatidylglycerol synthetase [Alteracholeplasma palmae J233]|uniref:Predicted lysylphosphatidylglycerol synthetase n=1 Tax=Alteracholeplasma palmae (strain ATCC 49389 / J233) TaxID=1318466 RepID=U4KLD4_ALTPJ|nr:lysylphosphatidylglycerol synthase transmembrane domain-containing protein [Alteracholeplasma palmae]CCV64613.1 predicted lysylphosphatidylglycerol synthetase [Alteracholeplasma palmae J233]